MNINNTGNLNHKNERRKVAVILLNYKGWEDTVECAESVLNSSYRDFQLIIVDNGSSDGSVDKIKLWAEGKICAPAAQNVRLRNLSFPPAPKPLQYFFLNWQNTPEWQGKSGDGDIAADGSNAADGDVGADRDVGESGGLSEDARLIIIQTGSNLGFAGGNNVGIKYALSRNNFNYLWILNNDTVIEKYTLKNMLALMEKDDTIGMAGSPLLRYYDEEKLQVLCGTTPMNWKNGGKGKHIFNIFNEKTPSENDEIRGFEIKGYLIGASMFIRKKTIEEIGLFDEALFMWAEDSDLCMRAIKKNWKLYCCCGAKVWHKEGSSTGREKHKRFLWKKSFRPSSGRFFVTGYLNARNHIYFVKKHYGNMYVVPYFLLNLPFFLKEIARILMYDDDKFSRIAILFKGVKDGIRGKMGKPDIM